MKMLPGRPPCSSRHVGGVSPPCSDRHVGGVIERIGFLPGTPHPGQVHLRSFFCRWRSRHRNRQVPIRRARERAGVGIGLGGNGVEFRWRSR
jgi:hypothetical protein